MLSGRMARGFAPAHWPRNAPPDATEYGGRSWEDNRPAVRVYRPCRPATQSGMAGTRQWLLEFDSADPLLPEPLMGWTSSRDPRRQLRLGFPTRESAVDFALRQGWRVMLREEPRHRPRPKRYADRFRIERLAAARLQEAQS